MSLAMKEAQFAQGDFNGDAVGDPGIFGVAGRFAGGLVKKAVNVGIDILPGPVGFVARKGRAALRGRRVDTISPRRSRPGVGTRIPGFRQPRGFTVRGRGTTGRAPSADIDFGFGGGQIADPVFLDGGAPVGATVGTTGQPVPACAQGFHRNKSGYYRRTPAGGVVFIQPESVCVRNRRIDPGNTRATKRAISRIRSAKRLKDALGGVTVHKKPC